ncbi:DUF2269 domain-containing protein [Alicyclobacillus tolerans]|uniref:DUF2269 domain-containing protein n=1 Tax=Alicyclobacillus tolerans TaxID=90970 RepID=UPI001F31D27F|nr:DUF2269 domain-containing protein [Alicyclobacillus tolerans]MCF8567879.1 DUF2269 domain-containing protein [Alicyclobacillus tolerans]
MLVRLLLFIHVFSVTLAIGPFFVLLPLTQRLRSSDPQEQAIYLDVFRLAIRWAKHAGHLLILTGILLWVTGPWPWTTPWIDVTSVILIGSLVFLARAFSPTLRKLKDSPEDAKVLVGQLRRSIWIYIVLLMAMLAFMVTKPPLW